MQLSLDIAPVHVCKAEIFEAEDVWEGEDGRDVLDMVGYEYGVYSFASSLPERDWRITVP